MSLRDSNYDLYFTISQLVFSMTADSNAKTVSIDFSFLSQRAEMVRQEELKGRKE
jgi:hypothetical protein